MHHFFLTAYIDPGTGSMLFTIVIGIAATASFMLRSLKMKLKFSQKGKDAALSAARVPYVIFSEGKRYWGVFRPVLEEFEARGTGCEYWTMSEDDPAFGEGYQYVKPVFIGEGNKAFARLNMMKADVCLATTPGLDVYQWKRSPEVGKYVHIFHALDEGLSYRMFGLDYYDEILTTGEFCEQYIREMEELRKLPAKEIRVVGSTYMDALKQKKDNFVPEEKAEKDAPTVLLAPTWGPSGILSRYGEELITALKAAGCQLIIRPHPQSKISEAELLAGLQEKFPESENLSWNFDSDNFAALSASDILISDFSGVIFDFTLLFDRPMLYADTSFDPAPYDLAWSEKPFWKFETLPRLGRQLKKEDFPNLRSVIDDMLKASALQEEREKVKAECWQNIGRAAEKTVDILTGKEA